MIIVKNAEEANVEREEDLVAQLPECDEDSIARVRVVVEQEQLCGEAEEADE